MAAASLFRVYGELTGLGNDKEVSGRASLSDVPTKGGGPQVQVIATTPTLIDTIGIISGEMVALYCMALSGDIHIDPFSTAVVTTRSCFLAEGICNLFTFEAAISNVPSAQAVTAVSKLEYLIVGVT